jgi:transcriptional regulator with XRE-family HTH domain
MAGGKSPGIPADTFSARLLLSRLHAGNVTIRDAAARCGIKHESWSSWERGGHPRDLPDVVERVSGGLGVDRDWLMWGGPLSAPERRDPLARRLLTRGSPTGSYGATTDRPQCVPDRRTSPLAGRPNTPGVTHRTGRVVRPVS